MVVNHTRATRFGIDRVTHHGKVYEFNFFDYIVDLFKSLDADEVKAHEHFLSAAHYLGNRYQEDILGRTVKDPWTQFEMNPVEHLTYSTLEFEYMQLYTTYDMFDLYRMDFDKWWNQSFGVIEFQLKIGRQIHAVKKAAAGDKETELDEEKITQELIKQEQMNGFQGQWKR